MSISRSRLIVKLLRLTVKLDFETSRVYLHTDGAAELFLLESDFRLEAEALVVKERRERGHRTAVNGFGLRGVDLSSHRQRDDVFRIDLRVRQTLMNQ